ncbi:MAG: hypothetical protein GY869_25360 [Planctomycetes bacterium]|nr:hypothetical protein [Planctomycetota bacterium]
MAVGRGQPIVFAQGYDLIKVKRIIEAYSNRALACVVPMRRPDVVTIDPDDLLAGGEYVFILRYIYEWQIGKEAISFQLLILVNNKFPKCFVWPE